MDALSSVSPSGAHAGLQAAQDKMARAAAVIADPASSADLVSLSAAAVALQSAGAAFEADIQVIRARQESLGGLVDTLA